MHRKFWNIVCVAFVAFVIVGMAAYVVRDSVASNRRIAAIEQETDCNLKALETARVKAKEVVREKLRRDEAKLVKANPKAATKRAEASKRRRNLARRLFMSRGFTASASYKSAVEMPKDPPSPEDQEIIDLAGESASEADLDTAEEVLDAALESKDPRARLAAVEMLSGLGEAGLVEISEFLDDPHPEVANLAADRWELGIQDLTDATEQTSLAKVGFLAITDEDQLRSLGGTLMLVSDAKLAVDMLAEVIRDGVSVQRAAAREAYESVTGEKWVDEKAATAWLAANYEPPEPEEESVDTTQGENNESEQ